MWKECVLPTWVQGSLATRRDRPQFKSSPNHCTTTPYIPFRIFYILRNYIRLDVQFFLRKKLIHSFRLMMFCRIWPNYQWCLKGLVYGFVDLFCTYFCLAIINMVSLFSLFLSTFSFLSSLLVASLSMYFFVCLHCFLMFILLVPCLY